MGYYKYEFFRGRQRDTKSFYCESAEEAHSMAEKVREYDRYDSCRISKGILEDWDRPDFTNEMEWFRWMHTKEVGGREDIEFVTNKGTEVVLKWKKGEYRAFFRKTNRDMMLGAIRTDNLIKYIQQMY